MLIFVEIHVLSVYKYICYLLIQTIMQFMITNHTGKVERCIFLVS